MYRMYAVENLSVFTLLDMQYVCHLVACLVCGVKDQPGRRLKDFSLIGCSQG